MLKAIRQKSELTCVKSTQITDQQAGVNKCDWVAEFQKDKLLLKE